MRDNDAAEALKWFFSLDREVSNKVSNMIGALVTVFGIPTRDALVSVHKTIITHACRPSDDTE